MKVSEFLGTKVLDKNAVEIGKVSDMIVDPLMGQINIITISTGEFGIRKKDIKIKPNKIAAIGDYVLLNIEKSDIEID